MIASLPQTSMGGLLSSLHALLAGDGHGPAALEPRPAKLLDRDRFTFSSGNVISRKGKPIDPKSAEGRTIESILSRQRADRAANAAQHARFWAITRSAIPRSFVEGRTGLESLKVAPGITWQDLLPGWRPRQAPARA